MGASITKACNCKCGQETDEEEINRNSTNNPDSISKNKKNDNDSNNVINTSKSNNKKKNNNNHPNYENDLSIIKEQENGEFGIDLNEPTVENFENEPFNSGRKGNSNFNNNNSNFKSGNYNLD